MNLPVQYLTPMVLRCSRFDGYSGGREARYASRTVYDYELEYYIRGEGGIVIDGTFVAFRAGEMNIRKPGQVVEGVPPYECYILCVDMVGNAKRAAPYLFGTPEEAQEAYGNPLLQSLPDKLAADNPQLLASLLDMIHRFHAMPGDLAYFQTKSALSFLFAELFQQAAGPSAGGSGPVSRAVETILARYGEPLSIEELIRDSGYGKAFFHQQFRRETGVTPGRFIARLRIDRAKELLAITDRAVGEIGALCGYEDNGYFARVFRRETGLTPGAYRSRVRQGARDSGKSDR